MCVVDIVNTPTQTQHINAVARQLAGVFTEGSASPCIRFNLNVSDDFTTYPKASASHSGYLASALIPSRTKRGLNNLHSVFYLLLVGKNL